MIEASPKRNIFVLWFNWHFFEAPRGILKGWRNFLVFNFHYFSIIFLLKTLLAHWRKYRASYGRGLDIKRYFSAFLFNLFSRLIGAIVRMVLIIIGLLVEVFLLATGIVCLLIWFFLPFWLVLGIYYGVQLII